MKIRPLRETEPGPRSPLAPLAPLRRGMAVLARLAHGPAGCSFSELREIEPHLYAASLSRLLRAMQDEGLVVQGGTRGPYQIGPAFLALARQVVGGAAARETIHPVVESLAAETGQSVAWFEPDGSRMILGAKKEVPEAFHYIPLFEPVGHVLEHGFGQILFPWAGAARRKALLDAHGPLPRPAAAYAKRQREILKGLRVVPDWGRSTAPIRIAAPVFRGEGGDIAGVLGISLWRRPARTSTLSAYTDAVGSAARRATALLDERTPR